MEEQIIKILSRKYGKSEKIIMCMIEIMKKEKFELKDIEECISIFFNK